MLFQRLYNWIKYKTLPPSFLFKNRLFIERDSKNKRILTNFGLVYRNSKWSNLEMINVKTQFKNNYFRLISFFFYTLLFIFLIYNFNLYYIFYYGFNNFIFIFWISLDSFDYYLSFIMWFFAMITSIFLNFIYSYLFFNNFSKNFSSNNKVMDLKTFKFRNNYNDKFVAKNDLTLITHSWLTNVNSFKSNKIFSNIFDVDLDPMAWNKIFNFYNYLYRTFFHLNKTNLIHKNSLPKSNLLDTHSDKINMNKFFSLFCNYKISKTTTALALFDSYNINMFKNKRFDWNMNFFDIKNKNYNYLFNNKVGFFYFNNLDFGSFSNILFTSKETYPLSFYFKNQLKTAKWNRWLYRYSILHRKLLKNSHKITLTKKLITSDNLNSKFFDKNLWNTVNSSNLFNNYFYNNTSIENNYFLNHKFNHFNDLNLKKNSQFLKYYETSYFWFIKRFYFFNNLSTNDSLSLNKNNLNTEYLKLNDNKQLLNYNFLYSNLLKSFSLTTNDFNISKTFHLESTYDLQKETNFNYFNNKDNSLILNELSFFTKENLNNFFWITSTINHSNQFVFFDTLILSNILNKTIKNNFLVSKNNTNDLNYFLFLSLLYENNYLLEDVYYLNKFLN